MAVLVKIISFIIPFSLASFVIHGQSITKNELGLDATGFIRFFTKFQSNDDYFYTPTYYITYRRLFEPGNIRFGVGGELDNFQKTGLVGDSSVYHEKNNALSTRIGWEWKLDLSKRWSSYYGVDLRYTYNMKSDEATYFSGGYAVGLETKTKIFGVAPILGIRFIINDRISILTEASFSFNYAIGNAKNTFKPLTGYPEKEDNVAPLTKSYFTTFSQPISVYFVFNL